MVSVSPSGKYWITPNFSQVMMASQLHRLHRDSTLYWKQLLPSIYYDDEVCALHLHGTLHNILGNYRCSVPNIFASMHGTGLARFI